MKIKKGLGFFLGLSVIATGFGGVLFSVPVYADFMPTTCEGIKDSCAVVTSAAELESAIVAAKATVIIGADFNTAHDMNITHSMSLYLGDYTITIDAADGAFIYRNGESHIYGGEGKIVEVGGTWAPIYLYGGDLTLHSGTVEVSQNAAGIYADTDSGEAQLIIDGGTITSSAKHGVFADNGAKIWLKSGTINARRWPVNLRDAEFTMDGGIINATCVEAVDQCYGIASNGSENGPAIILNAGEINSGYLGMYLPGIDGTTIINEGIAINSEYGGIEIRAGALTINGGEINVDSEAPYSVAANGNGNTSTGAAIMVAQHNTKKTINVEIKGGAFTAPIAINEANPQGNSAEDLAKVSVRVDGGIFANNNGEAAKSLVYSENYTGFIEGGRFSAVPIVDYVASNKEVYDTNETVPYLVADIMPVVDVEPVYLQAGETYTYNLGNSGTYATIASNDTTIATVDGMTATAGNKLGNTSITTSYGGLLERQTSSYGFYTYEVKAVKNDDAKSEEERDVTRAAAADLVAEFLAADTNEEYKTEEVWFKEGAAGIIKSAIADGEEITSRVEMVPMDEETMALVEAYAEEAYGGRLKVAAAYDVDVDIFAGDEYVGSILKLSSKIQIVFEIPEDLRKAPAGYKRVFYVLREHGGEVKFIDATFDDERIIAESDLFSAYVLVYEDEVDASAPETGVMTNTKDFAVKNSKFGVMLLAGGMMILGYGLIAQGKLYQKEKENKE